MAGPLTKSVVNASITLTLWVYYIMGYLLYYAPFYGYAALFSPRKEQAFQRLNHLIHRRFFTLVRCLVPRTTWRIAPEVRAIRSSVIIANHLSFLDPILFVALFEKQKTIVKRDYFDYPVFGWILRMSGYMPAMSVAGPVDGMMDQIKGMRDYLASGGNLFIFPEGTRSRDGRIGPFDKGGFRIAKLCRAPIQVVRIRHTDKLYPPDSLWFNTRDAQCIEMELAGTLTPDYDSDTFSHAALMAEARAVMEQGMRP